jgi:hypothetical protein
MAQQTKKPVAKSSATIYEDFVIVAKRRNARTIGIRVEASPAGRMTKQATVAFSAHEGAELHASFISTGERAGRMMITLEEAAAIGKRLAKVLFPGPVFQFFAKSLGMVARRPNGGLRIRLDMDETLGDLPWEYVRRPDRPDAGAMSGFLLLDASISMVRQRVDPTIDVEPIKGRQSLAFVGTLWEGRFYSSAITSERYFLICQRYIELNPVRAGLVADAAEFAWSSYAHNALGRLNPLLTEHEIYRRLGPTRQAQCKAYRALFGTSLHDDDLATIRTAIHSRQVLGDAPDLSPPARRGRPSKQRESDPVDGQLKIRL